MKQQENQFSQIENKQLDVAPSRVLTPPSFSFSQENGKSEESGGLEDGIDFFDTEGNHLYKDYSSKNEIRILEKVIWQAISTEYSKQEKCEEDGLEKLSQTLCSNSTRLDQYKLGEDNGFGLL